MIPADHLSAAVVERLQIQFPALRLVRSGGDSVIGLDDSELNGTDTNNLAIDLAFYLHNPSLPLENLCSRLDNYEPRTESQKELLRYAYQLAELNDSSRGAGLFIYGDAGIGKSHIAVGISKNFMSKGLLPTFMSADTYTFNTHLDLESGQVWIIDDLNSGYGLSSRLYKKVILNIHDKGGRVFVTSNKPYEDLLKEMFVGEGSADRTRYDDRTRSMFKILKVHGDSYRQDTAWYK